MNSIERKPVRRQIIHQIMMLFGLLFFVIIANAFFSAYHTSKDIIAYAEKELDYRLKNITSIHQNQIDKLATISLIVTEQNQKFCDFIDYDNVRALTYMLKSLGTIHDVDTAVIFNEIGQIITTYPKGSGFSDIQAYKSLITIKTEWVGIEEINPQIVMDQFTDNTYNTRAGSTLGFKSTIPLVHDTGEIYGHVVLVKFINGNDRLAEQMVQYTDADIFYFDRNQAPILTNLPLNTRVEHALDQFIINGQSYLSAKIELNNYAGIPIGELAIAFSNENYLSQKTQLLFSHILPFVISIFISIAFFLLLKRRVFNKVHRLSQALRMVTSGKSDLSIRLLNFPESKADGSDEIENMCIDFNHMMDKLEDTYNEMVTVRGDVEDANRSLELRVKRRTSIISEMYDDLKLQMEERRRAETERKELELRLERVRKMEALGTLAGGVAHDLNNILSGIVSYPELLLLELSEDSPLRKPVLTIKQSGEKAAQIVQDLLTLARRGVASMVPVNLNATIKDYLNSPEFEKLKSYHPKLLLTIELAEDLFNVMGSTIHLSKTIMNLVSNAAEAMPDGGKLIIRTENRYVDAVIKGYDNIDEGNYCILTVSDSGIGISEDNLERIFEPFFTKKIMGRSGTGLGMSVVWGTVKDHHGYIDVRSQEGSGTTFNLYFPVTRVALQVEGDAITLESIKGNGESVLVVDDVEEQREIASKMVEKLGYRVHAVDSGEAAIAYLTEQAMDILILDMIMTPGIDGLQTYKKIIGINPRQKAIIASGFSETADVRTAQELGAGEYIKKPYSLEQIGKTLRRELEDG
ncbi:MAG: response regulator [Desulfobacteraceae bacterium]|nr:response regulator [Desulfobacteraceae bacterium]